jgi:hypothetical protein
MGDLNRIFVPIKVGTNGAYEDSMILGYIAEKDWGLPFEKIVAPGSLGSKVYRYAQIDPALLPKVIALQAPVGFLKTLGPLGEPLPDPDTHKIIGGAIPLADVADYCKVSVDDLRKQDAGQEPINLVGVDLLKDIRTITPEGKIVDLATFSIGNKNYGTGGDYATRQLAIADWAATGLTGASSITMISAVTETAQSVLNIPLAGFALSILSSVDPLGNFGAGWLSTESMALMQAGALHITCSSASAGASINISKLNQKMTGAITYWVCGINLLSATTNITNIINNCLCNANGLPILSYRGGGGASNIVKMFNCVAANGYGSGTLVYLGGIVLSSSASSIIENCSVYNFTKGTAWCSGFNNYNNVAMTIKNLACFGNAGGDFTYGVTPTAGFGSGVASKCASSDTTGSEAGLRSLVAANEFRSTTLADGDPFLRVKLGGQLANGGVAPGIAANTAGNRGNTRGRGSPASYSIGADEFNVAPFAHVLQRRRSI